ncbi:MAG: hypothetical protein H0W72_06990 [Planctomycetes bacterium]|nr:hypothetical protein [Planctomycetota bacterium]
MSTATIDINKLEPRAQIGVLQRLAMIADRRMRPLWGEHPSTFIVDRPCTVAGEERCGYCLAVFPLRALVAELSNDNGLGGESLCPDCCGAPAAVLRAHLLNRIRDEQRSFDRDFGSYLDRIDRNTYEAESDLDRANSWAASLVEYTGALGHGVARMDGLAARIAAAPVNVEKPRNKPPA